MTVLWLPAIHICEHTETKLIIQITLTSTLTFFLCDYIHGRITRSNISCQKMPREMLLKCQKESILCVIVDDCCHCKMSKLAAPHHLQQLLPVEKYNASLRGQKSTRKEVCGILYQKDLVMFLKVFLLRCLPSQQMSYRFFGQILSAFGCREENVIGILLQEGTQS